MTLEKTISQHVSCLCTHDTPEDEVFTDNQKEDYFCLTSASLASSHESPFPQTFLLLDLLPLWFPIELSKSQICFILWCWKHNTGCSVCWAGSLPLCCMPSPRVNCLAWHLRLLECNFQGSTSSISQHTPSCNTVSLHAVLLGVRYACSFTLLSKGVPCLGSSSNVTLKL